MEKEIVKYLDSGKYAIYVPVFYDYEEKPAWRKMFVGTEKECKNNLDSFPDYMQATAEENANNRKNALQEYLLLMELGKKSKANQIKEQYKL